VRTAESSCVGYPTRVVDLVIRRARLIKSGVRRFLRKCESARPKLGIAGDMPEGELEGLERDPGAQETSRGPQLFDRAVPATSIRDVNPQVHPRQRITNT